MNFTDEQKGCVRASLSGKSLKIIAPPGSGKTTLLVGIAKAKNQEKGIYISFGRANKDEAQKKLSSVGNVKAKTNHGLAWGVGVKFQENRLKERLNGRVIADFLKINDTYYLSKEDGKTFNVSRNLMANLALDTVTRFCQVPDEVITSKCIPTQELSAISDVGAKQELMEHILFYSKKLWQGMSDTNGRLPTTHDTYFKLWTLDRPIIHSDYILLDEAQDTNSAMLDVLMRQRQSQLILVGDPHQSIFEWRGAVNSMNDVNTVRESSLTQSFRFGQSIANVANDILIAYKNIPSQIKGTALHESNVTACQRPDAIISRTNATLLSEMLDQLYNRSVKVVGGTAQLEMLLSGINDLKNNKSTQVRELALFNNYSELVEYSETASGQDIKSLIKQIDRFGLSRLQNAVKMVSATSSNHIFDVTLTTAHKAKGLEFDSVKLANDFNYPGKPSSSGFSNGDINLLYVAASRAKKTLDITQCEAANIAIEMSAAKKNTLDEQIDAAMQMTA